RVLAQDPGAFLDDLHDVRVAVCGRLKNNRSERSDFHLVRVLRPAHEIVTAIERERAENGGGKLAFAAMQIVFAQDETKRLHGKKITAACVTEDMAPSAGFLDVIAAPARDRCTGAGVDHNPVAAAKTGGEAGLAIASGDDFRLRPNLRAQRSQRGPVIGAATSQ